MFKHLSLLLISLLSGAVFMLGCSSSDGFSNSNTEESDQPSSFTLLSPEKNATLAYDHVTLEVKAADMRSLSAVNQSLVTEQNRTINITGVDNNGTYYLYNLPLIQGKNEINITTISEANVSLSSIINLTSEANGSAPIGMRAGSYTGIGSLETIVEAGTHLHVKEYLFDSNGDGIINETLADGNFSVNYMQEGRYRPRVTVRTADNVLYSSDDFSLSLDVKADANQSDPKGAEPIDEAKSYVQAIIDNDRESVERFFGNNERLINYIYANPKVQPFLAKTYKNITSWEQTYHNSGYASVKIMIDVNGTEYGGGFEMVTINPQIKTGRQWIIRFFY